jgi:Nucleotidyl transferase AbiEii toxin, Type IV TA system
VYETPAALRQAIDTRLNQRAREDGVEVNRLRRGLVFQRIMARFEGAEPGAWVVKGGMALEWRLGKQARGTRDLDLVLRGHAIAGPGLRERLVELLATDRGDRFLFEVGPAQPLDVGFRFSIRADLAGIESSPPFDLMWPPLARSWPRRGCSCRRSGRNLTSRVVSRAVNRGVVELGPAVAAHRAPDVAQA